MPAGIATAAGQNTCPHLHCCVYRRRQASVFSFDGQIEFSIVDLRSLSSNSNDNIEQRSPKYISRQTKSMAAFTVIPYGQFFSFRLDRTRLDSNRPSHVHSGRDLQLAADPRLDKSFRAWLLDAFRRPRASQNPLVDRAPERRSSGSSDRARFRKREVLGAPSVLYKWVLCRDPRKKNPCKRVPVDGVVAGRQVNGRHSPPLNKEYTAMKKICDRSG